MNTDNDTYALDFTDDQRQLPLGGLIEWAGPAHGHPLVAPLVGAATVGEFYELTTRLSEAIEDRQPLSALDWARALLLTEICWASNLLGAGVDWHSTRDENTIAILRSLQYTIGYDLQLLIDNAGFTPAEQGTITTVPDFVGWSIAEELPFLTLEQMGFPPEADGASGADPQP